MLRGLRISSSLSCSRWIATASRVTTTTTNVTKKKQRPSDIILDALPDTLRSSLETLAKESSTFKTLKQPVEVMKFGGSSVGSAQAFRDVAEISIKRNTTGNVVMVLSAMFGVTDHLVNSIEAAVKGDMAAVKFSRRSIVSLHEATLLELFSDTPALHENLYDSLHHMINTEFDAIVERTQSSGKIEPADRDVIHSLGERLSCSIMAMYLTKTGHASVMIPSEEIVVTDGKFGESMPLLAESLTNIRERLSACLKLNVVPIVPGFYGRSQIDGRITTFGRGGSDLTAALVGYAMDAEEVLLYKVEYEKTRHGWLDKWKPGWIGVVDSQDNTQTIPQLSYEEARELAHFGRKVLHPQTVYPAVQKEIPIRVANTLLWNHPGTIIHNDPLTDNPVAVVRVNLAEYSKKHGQKIELASGVGDWKDLPEEDIDIVAMIGQGILKRTEIKDGTDPVQTVLAAAGIPSARPVRLSGSIHNRAIVVPKDHAEEAAALLHTEFIQNASEQSDDPSSKMGVEVAVSDRSGMLAALCTAFESSGVSIEKAVCSSNVDGTGVCSFTFGRVDDVRRAALVSLLSKVEGVGEVNMKEQDC